MKTLNRCCHALSIGTVAAVLAGCGGSQPMSVPLSASTTGLAAGRFRPNVTYGVLYSFKGHSGNEPVAGLTNVNGKLYGVTQYGGAHRYGTVFSITLSGKHKVLYSFGGAADGANPVAALENVNGTLYGTTKGGGANKGGTVFSITPSGTLTVLHSFGAPGDGDVPLAGLIDVNGTLYGTTEVGGSGCGTPIGCGVVYTITTSGMETVLHSFAGGPNDGSFPSAGLIDVNGTLYGTTGGGGAAALSEGTVFSITLSGKEKVLHSFGVSSGDGEYPSARLINVNGTLYSTTEYGGANNHGTVFSITPSGKEKVLYSFGSGSGDGIYPVAALENKSGTLYSTTPSGGAKTDGTVFAVTLSGKERILHSFGGSGDGNTPVARLVNVNGAFYGTTERGGLNDDGTVFKLSL